MYTKDAILYSLNLADQAMMRSLETIEDAPLTFPTEKGGCHPLWVMGHLAFVEGLTHEMLGGGGNPVAHWAGIFGPDTVPTADAAQYPAFAKVRDRYVELRKRNVQLLEAMTEADLDQPTPWQPKGLEEHFATFGKALLTIAMHQMAHRGHITDAIRAAGTQISKIQTHFPERKRSQMRQVVAGLVLAILCATGARASNTTIEQMPATLETQFALSALPPAMRDQATVYLLYPKKGYQLSRQGTSGVTCLVERTAWEQADFRNDIYVPLCYDAEGSKSYLKVIVDAAALRIQGMSPAALKVEIENRYKNKTYKVPQQAGLSYMVAPVMRTWMLPDMRVHTMPMPHLMFYAPNLTNEDIGAVPNSSLLYPFVFKEGVAEQSYIIKVIGEAEKARIMADGKTLLGDLCAYRDVLCLAH